MDGVGILQEQRDYYREEIARRLRTGLTTDVATLEFYRHMLGNVERELDKQKPINFKTQ